MSYIGEQVSQASLSKQVMKSLRNSILSGQLKPGERIDQTGLADALGVSKLPVREAILALEADGLITIAPRKGAFVSALSPQDVIDHYVIFGRMAGLAAERAALAMQPHDLECLNSLHNRMTLSTDVDELQALNEQFHQLISKAGSSNRLRHVLGGLSHFLPSTFFEFFADNDSGVKATCAEHYAVLIALQARDPIDARAAMEHHFELRGIQAQQSLATRGFWDPITGTGREAGNVSPQVTKGVN